MNMVIMIARCLLVSCVCASLCLPFLAGAAPTPPLRVGVAEIDITPPAGHLMAGYFDERRATGVHDPLQAKAIVIQQGRRNSRLRFVIWSVFPCTFRPTPVPKPASSWAFRFPTF